MKRHFDSFELAVPIFVGFLWHASRFSDGWFWGAVLVCYLLNIIVALLRGEL